MSDFDMKKDANSSISKHFRNTYTEQFFLTTLYV